MAAWLPLITALVSAGGAMGSSILSRGKKTGIQGQQQELIDQLMGSLKGQGPYADLFKTDEEGFKRSYTDPMKQMFESQIAPQIQQSFIEGGQQRGTGMQNALTRAGVDMDQMLNQYYAQYKQQGQKNQMDAFKDILGMGKGVREESPWESALAGLGGYMGSSGFGSSIGDILKGISGSKPDLKIEDVTPAQRKGFESDFSKGRYLA